MTARRREKKQREKVEKKMNTAEHTVTTTLRR